MNYRNKIEKYELLNNDVKICNKVIWYKVADIKLNKYVKEEHLYRR